jgi:UDP-N-acetylmuramoyl-tripeptide--D-alanyl-D-alanine ligase
MINWKLLTNFYLLQLENYHLHRYWRVVGKQIDQSRQKIVWTPKAKLIFCLTCFLALLIMYFVLVAFTSIWSLIIWFFAWLFFSGVLLNYASPILLTLAVLLLTPLDRIVKNNLVEKAKKKIASLPNLKVIGITGSFGKTTMKESLATVLEQKYRVLKTPESINTPIGVARLILNHLDPLVEIFIVEMGAYERGDIEALCNIAPPNIALLTGINEAHLERFGSIENTIATKFEVVASAKPDALVVLNSENELVQQNYSSQTAQRNVLMYNNQPSGYKSQLLGDYANGVINACLLIAKELGLSENEIRAGVEKIRPIPHRLQLIPSNNGITVIDDSYNGNPAGVAEAIKVLSGFIGQRKIYITPGLVEMGSKTEDVHVEIGKQLGKVADVVILIKNSVTPFIAEGLKATAFDPRNVIWFETSQQAHAGLKDILKTGDVILFQNDWTDNYA